MSANHKLIASVARGEAIVLCPCCPEDSDNEGRVTVGRDDDERGPRATLDAFVCEALQPHTRFDLTPEQEAHILESAVEYIADAIEAMRDAADDARFDSWRDEGRYDYR